MAEVYDLDNTAANNNSAAPDGFPEGMNYSEVNNAAREQMAVLARYINATGVISTTGTNNDYLLTVPQTITSYVAGMRFSFKADRASIAGGATLKVNSAPTADIVNNDGSALSVAGDIALGAIVQVMYDGTNFVRTTPNDNAITQAEGDQHYIRQDGTSATTAIIPFAFGISAAAASTFNSSVTFNNTSDFNGVLNSFNTATFNSTLVAASTCTVRGTLSNDPATSGVQNSRLLLANSSGAATGYLGHSGLTTLDIVNNVHGGKTTFTNENAAGSFVVMFDMNPDGAIVGKHNNVQTFTTGTKATGGFLVRNSITNDGTADERVLTASDLPQVRRTIVGHSIATDTAVNFMNGALPGRFQFALQANLFYRFRLRIGILSTGGSTIAVAIAPRYSGTLDAGYWNMDNLAGGGFNSAASANAITSTTSLISAGNVPISPANPGVIRLDGYIRTTGAGDLSFNYASTTNVGGNTLFLKEGSFCDVEVCTLQNS